MEPRRTWMKWLGGLSALALLALFGVYVYQFGVARGVAEGAQITEVGGRLVPMFGWWRPWGFGFFPFFPFLILLFILTRVLFWRPWYGRRWHGRGGYGPGWDAGRDGVPPAFEEWHRRAHSQQEPPAKG